MFAKFHYILLFVCFFNFWWSLTWCIYVFCREFVKIDEAKLNNSIPMGCVNPIATTMENPWLDLNHQFPGMNNMMIQPQTNFVKIESEPSNNLQNDPRKRLRESMENQINNLNMPPITNNVHIQGCAPQSNLPVQRSWDIDYILSKFVSTISVNICYPN